MNKQNIIVLALALALVGPITALAASPSAINLGTAGNFVILSKAGVSTTGTTAVVGDIGVSPVAGSYITGFAVTLPSASAFSTSAMVTGKVYASDYSDPTPSNLTTAVLDMQTAFTDGMSRAPDVTELGAGNIGGLTLAPGVYKWGTGLLIPTDVTLSGSANDVWIFQIAQSLNVSSDAHITLAGGAQANNVFWIVTGQTTIGTTAVMNGNILDQTAIVLNTGATLNGRALAQTAVTLDSNKVTISSSANASVPPVIIPVIPPVSSGAVACTMEAMQCSDGSYVSRHGPSCAFDLCPVVNSPVITQPISTDARTAMQVQLNGLLATLQTLRAQQTAQTTLPVKMILVDLVKGSRGDDVKILQNFLIKKTTGEGSTALSIPGATGYFGELTRTALAEYQENVGINPPLGNFGSITRAYINAYEQR